MSAELYMHKYVYTLMYTYTKTISHLERTYNIIFYNITDKIMKWFHHQIFKDERLKQLLKLLCCQINSYKEVLHCLQKSLVALMTHVRI